MATLTTNFECGQAVHLDGDTALTAHVTGFLWRGNDHEVEVSWVCNGDLKSAWVASWRLSSAAR